MSYDLCFSPEFFLAEGEPYDRPDFAVNAKGQPTSVWSAICLIKEYEPKLWQEIAEKFFNTTGEFLTEDSVLTLIRKTNTCSNLNSPVEVWLDPQRNYTLHVY